MTIPQGDDKNEVRVTAIMVAPKGEPIFSCQATHIRIDDEAAGEFLVLHQEHDDAAYDGKLCIDRYEWPVMKEAIEYMLKETERNATP